MTDPAGKIQDSETLPPVTVGGPITLRPDQTDPWIDPFPGEFQVVGLLGEGAYGKVWLAEDVNLGRKVALKALKVATQDELGSRVRQALRRDAHLLAKLHHPNVVQVYAWRSIGDQCYLVMQYVSGGSLADRVRASGPMPLTEALACVADIGDGLREVHACGIVHRDIKPENILWEPNKARALLTDFGVSGHLATAKTVAGTPAYMAPEAFRGKASAASDVYSLCVSLFYLLTGDLPFPADTWDELMAMIAAGLPADDPRLKPFPAEVQEVLRSGLAISPESRLGLDELVVRLRELLRAQGVATTLSGSMTGSGSMRSGSSDQRPSEAPAPRLRSYLMWLGGLVLVATIATIAIVLRLSPNLLFPSPPSSDPASPQPWVPPPGFQAAANAKPVSDGLRLFPSRILFNQYGLNVPFVLVAKNRADDLPTFYIMENKVSNGLFQKFVESSSGTLTGAAWKEGLAHIPQTEGMDVAQLPAMNVSCEEAFQFAAWLGGTLPTITQWDKAAGRIKDNPGPGGPYKGSWNPQEQGLIAVGNLKAPLAVGTATADVSVFGCHDMAGNGLEWTSTAMHSGISLPLGPHDESLVMLRGKSYADDDPLSFEDWVDISEHYHHPSKYIGFRVVYPCPP